MTLTQSSGNPWDSEEIKAHTTPPTAVGSGSGGGDMDAWSQPRPELLFQLVTGAFTNNSQFTIPNGFTDVRQRSFDLSVTEGEKVHTTPSSGTAAGTGGGDLSSFDDARQQQLRDLVTTDYNNQSSRTLPKGVVDAVARKFDLSFEQGEKDHNTPGNTTEAGTGGQDLAAFEKNRKDLLRDLVVTDYSNASSQALPKGVVDAVARKFDLSFEQGEKDHIDPDTVNVGEGVELGRNVFDITVFGQAKGVNSDFPNDFVALSNANIEFDTDGVSPVNVSSADSGEFSVGMPKANATYSITISSPFIENTTIQLDVGDIDIEKDLEATVPLGSAGGSGSISLGGGINIL